MKKQNLFRKQKGITLVALVVTIVVLLILAGISINLVLGQNGIVAKAKDAKEKTARAGAEEKVGLEVVGSYGDDGNLDMSLLNENLKHIAGLTYNGEALSDTNKIESLPTTVVVDGFEVIIDAEGESTILGDMPEHPELSGYAWFVVGETEPDEESKDIAEYLIKSGHGQGTLIIYPRNGKSATITASELQLKTMYGEDYYLPQWCSELNEELANKITSVYVAPRVITEHATYFFYGLKNCEKIDITNLDTSKVTNMNSMFYCENLVEIKGTEKLNTSNVTDMGYMFDCCRKLKSLNTTNWNVLQVQNMEYMFDCCKELEKIEGISKWQVSNVTDMTYMFNTCEKLDNINLNEWDVAKVESMRGTFGACIKLETMDWISNWDVSSVKEFNVMFQNVPITTVDLLNWNVSNAENFGGMFMNCEELETLDLSTWNTSKVTNMGQMFAGCKKLTVVWTGKDWSDSQASTSAMFYGCTIDHVTPKDNGTV